MANHAIIDDVIPKLKFIARLKKGDKINVKNMYVQPMTLYNRIDRSFFNHDDRSNTYLFVADVIKKGFDLFSQHVSSVTPYNEILCANIFTDIQNTKQGLIHLKETYNDDMMFTCKIDSLIEDIHARLTELAVKHKIKFDEKNE